MVRYSHTNWKDRQRAHGLYSSNFGLIEMKDTRTQNGYKKVKLKLFFRVAIVPSGSLISTVQMLLLGYYEKERSDATLGKDRYKKTRLQLTLTGMRCLRVTLRGRPLHLARGRIIRLRTAGTRVRTATWIAGVPIDCRIGSRAWRGWERVLRVRRACGIRGSRIQMATTGWS